MAKRERLLFRVRRDGVLEPADGITQGRCRERGYCTNDLLLADLAKPRHPGQWRCAHRLAGLVKANIEGFEHKDHHEVLKQFQVDGRIACDLVEAVTEDGEVVRVYSPESLSFASMDQGKFEEVYKAFCEHIRVTYWPEIDSDEEIAAMAEMFSREVA